MKFLILLLSLFLASPAFCQGLAENYLPPVSGPNVAVAESDSHSGFVASFTTANYRSPNCDSICQLTRNGHRTGTVRSLIFGGCLAAAGGGLFYYGHRVESFGLIMVGIANLSAGIITAAVGGIIYLVEEVRPPTAHEQHKHRSHVSMSGSGNTLGLALHF